jgi:nucleoside-diphosphate-sugar epimerase
MLTVGIVGARGYLGSALCIACGKVSGHSIVAITRDNYADSQKLDYDVLINCAMPSARFWAKNNPQKDFVETVQKTADLVYGWNYRKFVQISTVSARCQLDTVYGRNKASAEALCSSDHLIVRLGAIYDKDMKKGVLVDMIQGNTVFVDGGSRYCFAARGFVAGWISSNLGRSGIVEVGGRNAVSLNEVARHIGSLSAFEGALDHQEVEASDPDYPEARDVLTFLDNWKRDT